MITDQTLIDQSFKFSGKKILIIGELILDEYLMGNVTRISPEAPVPIVHQQKTQYLLGGAGNVVRNLRKLRTEVYVVSIIGHDPFAKEVQRLIRETGVIPNTQAHLYASKERNTIRKTRVFAQNQQVCRIDYENVMPSTKRETEFLKKAIDKNISTLDAIIFSDYDKGLLTKEIVEYIINLANKHQIFIAADPQIRNFEFYRMIHLMTPNHLEAGRFLGVDLDSQKSVEKHGQELQKRLDLKYMLITQGAQGMTLFCRNDKPRHFSTQAQEIYDVTGAGDTVIALMTLTLCCGWDPENAVRLANLAAGIVVSKLGASAPTIGELTSMLKTSLK